MIKSKATYYVGNTNYFEVIGLKNSITENYVNNATVTMTMKYLNGNPVTGATTPLVFIPSGSEGNYTLSFDLPSLVPGDRTVATVIAVNFDGFKKEWDVKVICKQDNSTDNTCCC